MRELFLRYGWLTLVGALVVNRDMCLGGGKPPARDPQPVDSGGQDSSSDTGTDAKVRRARVVRGVADVTAHFAGPRAKV